MRRRMTPVFAVMLVLPAALAPQVASAGLFDFLFGNSETAARPATPVPQTNSYSDPSAQSAYPATATPAPAASGNGRFTSYCVRSCDGRYFPISARGGATPAQMCQSFCPASPTKIYSGNGIDYAVGPMGERYVDTPNAFAYRKALKADCTCNGRDPAGLAPVDLSLDTTLRPGDIVATSNGLVAYSGTKTANGQTAEFTPVANYPGLTADLRARLGEMKVAPVSAEIADDAPYTSSVQAAPVPNAAPSSDALRPLIESNLPPLPTGEFKPIPAPPRAKRADIH
jgi:hypothetical protein